jgi:predicted ATPase/signal transduction histidine kinase
MSDDLPAYRVTETLLASERRIVYRGLRIADERPVLLKVLGPRHALPRDVERLEHERKIVARLDGSAASTPPALDVFQGLPALLMDDPGGQPLSSLLPQALEIRRFLRLAGPMAAALAKVHQLGVIHKDIQPASFIVDEVAVRVRLIDFGIASLLPREHQTARNPLQIEGTLAYMSPEQTGRMNRPLDHRSDLYSLGVTLYEALTGRLPFAARDPLEWIHCHVARDPRPPGETVPAQLAQLLLKLLAKEADRRYQSAAGLAHDLERCRADWEATGAIDPFPLGQKDGSDRLVIPQRLYGREKDSTLLLQSFERVAASGRQELVMVSGAAGTGKTFLVHELHRPVAQAHGLFLAGKFDQRQREVPYATLVQAFRELILDLLTESDERLSYWRQRLLSALHGNGRLITDVIPQLALIIGPQPSLEELRPRDAQLRFELVMLNFIAAFAAADRPVVLFLDDLQWADRASLRMLEQLAVSGNVRSLLLVGAVRSQEVEHSGAVLQLLAKAARSATPVLRIHLEPLSASDVHALVVDTVGNGDRSAALLSGVVFERTGGNPYFVVHFLATLSQESLITRDPDTGRWHWDQEEVAARPTTGNLVDFLVEKVRRLPSPLQALLRAAACLGNLHQTSILSTLCARPVHEIEQMLVDLTREGMVARVAGAYRFAHDRVWQAAYSLTAKADRPRAHLEVGRMLYARMPPEGRAEAVFEMVTHFNRGASLITEPLEAQEVAALNLMAGLRAKTANAHYSAIGYLAIGMGLLRRAVGEDNDLAVWRSHYALAYALQLARAECELLDHQIEQALERAVVVVQRARTPRERVPAYLLQRDAYLTQGRLDETLAVEQACLKQFGIDLPARPSESDVRASTARIRELLGDRPIEAIVDLPLTSDPDLQAALLMTSSASFTDQTLYLLHAAKMVALSLEQGNAEGSVFWYGCYGYALAGQGRYREGHRFANAAFALHEKHGFVTSRGQSHFFLGLTSFWTEPLRRSRAHMAAALELWQSTGGPRTGVALATFNDVYGAFIGGDPLDHVQERAERGMESLRSMSFRDLEDMCRVLVQVTRALQGQTSHLGRLQGEGFDEARFAAGLVDRRFSRLSCWYWLARMQLAFMAGNHLQAMEAGDRAMALAWSVAGNLPLPELVLFDALTRAAAFDEGSSSQREAWLSKLGAHEEQLRSWAEENPSVFRHQHLLVRAEIARIGGRQQEAADLYKESITRAAAGGFIQHEALAYELGARLREQQGLPAMADLYRVEARSRYLRWGATAKVEQLDQRYSQLALASGPSGPTILLDSTRIDLLSVATASQAISREVVPEKLRETLMRVILAQSGATRGVLLVPREQALSVEAVAQVKPDGIEVSTEREALATELAAVPESVLRFTWRTGEALVLDDAAAERRFADDAYIRGQRPQSLLCLPILRQQARVALLYLENHSVRGAFTPDRLTVLGVLAGQVAISLENSLLFQRLTGEIEERKRAEDAVRFLLDSGDALVQSLDYQATLTRLARLAVGSLADWCVVDVIEDSGQFRRVAAAHRDPEKEVTLLHLRERLSDRGPPLYAVDLLEADGPKIFSDVSQAFAQYEHDRESVQTVMSLGSGSAMVLTLRAREHMLGTMTLVSATPYPAGEPPNLELAQQLASRAAIAIDNARLYREAQEAIRLRDEFLSIASHELNTPLATLRLLTEGLDDAKVGANPDMLASSVRIISRQTRRLSALVSELLNVTRISAGPLHLKLEAVDLGPLVKDVVDRFGQEISRAQCSVNLRATEPVVGLWDRSRLEQVVTNLLSNALKFGAGRPIDMSVEAAGEDMARLTVTDHGIGISPEQVPKIFGRFSRAVSATHYGGLGLGLYIVSQIVRALGGAVNVNSRPGAGSTFMVELPLDSSTVSTGPPDRRAEGNALT